MHVIGTQLIPTFPLPVSMIRKGMQIRNVYNIGRGIKLGGVFHPG